MDLHDGACDCQEMPGFKRVGVGGSLDWVFNFGCQGSGVLWLSRVLWLCRFLRCRGSSGPLKRRSLGGGGGGGI